MSSSEDTDYYDSSDHSSDDHSEWWYVYEDVYTMFKCGGMDVEEFTKYLEDTIQDEHASLFDDTLRRGHIDFGEYLITNGLCMIDQTSFNLPKVLALLASMGTVPTLPVVDVRLAHDTFGDIIELLKRVRVACLYVERKTANPADMLVASEAELDKREDLLVAVIAEVSRESLTTLTYDTESSDVSVRLVRNLVKKCSSLKSIDVMPIIPVTEMIKLFEDILSVERIFRYVSVSIDEGLNVYHHITEFALSDVCKEISVMDFAKDESSVIPEADCEVCLNGLSVTQIVSFESFFSKPFDFAEMYKDVEDVELGSEDDLHPENL